MRHASYRMGYCKLGRCNISKTCRLKMCRQKMSPKMCRQKMLPKMCDLNTLFFVYDKVMDTQHWGPSGWKLLHTLAYAYEKKYEREYRRLFTSLQYILPCIYCRRSYAEFISIHPIRLESRKSLTMWIYTIHNCVNDKLRKQGYSIPSDPSLYEVDEMYLDAPPVRGLIGKEFLYCILFNYHLGISARRQAGYLAFFKALACIWPNRRTREKIMEFMETYPLADVFDRVDSDQSICPLKRWGHQLEKCIVTHCCTYKKRCELIERFRVHKCTGGTCRAGSRSGVSSPRDEFATKSRSGVSSPRDEFATKSRSRV